MLIEIARGQSQALLYKLACGCKCDGFFCVVLGSIPTRENELFTFPRFDNGAKAWYGYAIPPEFGGMWRTEVAKWKRCLNTSVPLSLCLNRNTKIKLL